MADKADKQEMEYPHPKIMLIGFDSQTHDTLVAAGYNVDEGFVGKQYRVEMHDNLVPVLEDVSLPYYQEKEIVVINLLPTSIADTPTGKKGSSLGTNDYWVSASSGIVDPRLVILNHMKSLSQRILDNGGIFIVFAAVPISTTFLWGHIQGNYGFKTVRREELNNYGFLDDLNSEKFVVKGTFGNEIYLNHENLNFRISQILAQYIGEAEYQCTFHATQSLGSRWITLAKNKFDAPVSGILISPKEPRGSIPVSLHFFTF